MERENGKSESGQTPQPGPETAITGILDLSGNGVTKNDIISGRVQRVAVDGSQHDVRAQLQANNGEYFNVKVRGSDEPVRCVLAGIESTNHAMKSTVLGTGSIDATSGDDPISLVLFRRA